MRVDKSTGIIHTEVKYYIIEEYQSKWDRWRTLTHWYLREYEFGEFSACGQCWQETGIHGCYDLEYVKEYCNKLNEALSNGLLKDKIETSNVTKFRVCECEKIFKKKPLIADKY